MAILNNFSAPFSVRFIGRRLDIPKSNRLGGGSQWNGSVGWRDGVENCDPSASRKVKPHINHIPTGREGSVEASSAGGSEGEMFGSGEPKVKGTLN